MYCSVLTLQLNRLPVLSCRWCLKKNREYWWYWWYWSYWHCRPNIKKKTQSTPHRPNMGFVHPYLSCNTTVLPTTSTKECPARMSNVPSATPALSVGPHVVVHGSGKKYRERTIGASVRGLNRCTLVEDRHYLGSPPRCPNSAHRPNCRRCHCECAGHRFERCFPNFPTGTPLSGSGAPRRCWHDQQ